MSHRGVRRAVFCALGSASVPFYWVPSVDRRDDDGKIGATGCLVADHGAGFGTERTMRAREEGGGKKIGQLHRVCAVHAAA